MEYTTIISFLGTAGSAVLLTHLFTKNKQNMEIQNLLGKTYVDMIESMRAEIDRLRDRMSALETEINHLRDRVAALETELKQLKTTLGCKPKTYLRKV
ncbi:MAG: hypothetical protein E6Q66_04655 [Pedobacter sp.]|nr:MAG: hypothetical protein E6Q66_04655 [Pedobacter sp.]